MEDKNNVTKENKRSLKFFIWLSCILFILLLVVTALWIVSSFPTREKKSEIQIASTEIATVEYTDVSQKKSPEVEENVASVTETEDVLSIEVDEDIISDVKFKDSLLKKSPFTKLDRERLNNEHFDGAFLKMHELTYFDEASFEEFRGIHVVVPEGLIRTFKDISEALDMMWTNPNKPSEVYMEFEPYTIWIQSGKDEQKRDEALLDVEEYISDHPETIFEIAYSFPNVAFWNALKEEDYASLQEVYYHISTVLMKHNNVYVYAPGNQEWLVCNPTNYESAFVTGKDASTKLMCHMFCDRDCKMELEQIVDWFVIVKNLSDCSTKWHMYEYDDLSSYKVVFVGDSVLDFFRTTYGIPDIVKYFTKAETYNLSKGGASSAGKGDSPYHLAAFVNAITTGEMNEKYAGTEFEDECKRFRQEVKTDDEMIFVLMLGINDFLNGEVSINKKKISDIKTTAGGLVNAVNTLKEVYPNAKFIIVSPYHMDIDEDLPSQMCEFLKGELFKEYVAAEKKAAKKVKAGYIALTENANINADTFNEMLSSDGIHPSEAGELEIAKVISKYLCEKYLTKNQ